MEHLGVHTWFNRGDRTVTGFYNGHFQHRPLLARLKIRPSKSIQHPKTLGVMKSMQLPSLIPHRPFADSSRESEDAKSEDED